MGFDLRLEDCLDVMGDLPAASVDLILADLPYGTTACKWDTVIPFGPLWAHYRRLLRPAGAVVLTASQPFTSALVMSNPEWFRYVWVWEKSVGTGFLDANRKPLKCHEDVLIFSAGRTCYRPQLTRTKPKTIRRSSNSPLYGVHERITTDNRGMAYPRSVIYFPKELGTVHPTQKPVALMEYLIRTYTDEGDTVLDNVMGSGTTGVACLRTDRNFIGIEKDPGYFAIAERRIAAESDRYPLMSAAR